MRGKVPTCRKRKENTPLAKGVLVRNLSVWKGVQGAMAQARRGLRTQEALAPTPRGAKSSTGCF